MSWTIQEVARLSGLTARALRHYDDIGLVRAGRSANGHRNYDEPQLVRLQQVLLLRQLGLDLATIGAVLDAEQEPLEALRRHHRRLTEERGRLDRLVASVAATIEHLEEGTDMPADEMFRGFTFDRDYLDRERERHGPIPELAEVDRNTDTWTDEDFAAFTDEGVQLELRMLALLRDEVAADDDAVFAVLDEDLALQRRLWEPDREGYRRIADGLTQPSEWQEHLNSLDPRLPGYLRAAMLAFADARLQ